MIELQIYSGSICTAVNKLYKQIAQCSRMKGDAPGSHEIIFWTMFFSGTRRNLWFRRKKCVSQRSVFCSFFNATICYGILISEYILSGVAEHGAARHCGTFRHTHTSHKSRGRVSQNKKYNGTQMIPPGHAQPDSATTPTPGKITNSDRL